MIASTRCRSQFGKGRGAFSSLRAGRISVRPRSGPAKNCSVSSPDRPLSVTTAVARAGRVAGGLANMLRGGSRAPLRLGLTRPDPGKGAAQVQLNIVLDPPDSPERQGTYPRTIP